MTRDTVLSDVLARLAISRWVVTGKWLALDNSQCLHKHSIVGNPSADNFPPVQKESRKSGAADLRLKSQGTLRWSSVGGVTRPLASAHRSRSWHRKHERPGRRILHGEDDRMGSGS